MTGNLSEFAQDALHSSEKGAIFYAAQFLVGLELTRGDLDGNIRALAFELEQFARFYVPGPAKVSVGYPYMSIAKMHGVDYGLVLRWVKLIQHSYEEGWWGLENLDDKHRPAFADTVNACRKERERVA